jgi:hypothetical protein
MTKRFGNKSNTGREKAKLTIMVLLADTRMCEPRRKERDNVNSPTG